MICLSIDRPPAQPVLSLAFFHLVFLYRFLDGLHSTLRHWSLEHAINIIMNRTVQLEASLTRHTILGSDTANFAKSITSMSGSRVPLPMERALRLFPSYETVAVNEITMYSTPDVSRSSSLVARSTRRTRVPRVSIQRDLAVLWNFIHAVRILILTTPTTPFVLQRTSSIFTVMIFSRKKKKR